MLIAIELAKVEPVAEGIRKFMEHDKKRIKRTFGKYIIWDTEEETRGVALQKYLMQPCLMHQVRSREPSVRMSARFWGCQS